MLSSKEAYIEALAMEVRGKDKMSQAKPEMVYKNNATYRII